MQRLEWRKVAVLSSQSTNFKNAKNSFLKIANKHSIKVELEIETSPQTRSPKQFLQELLRCGIKIVVAFVLPSEAIEILCIEYPNGFKWPDYAWIFAENIDNDILKNQKYCSKNISINNALFFCPQIRPLKTCISTIWP